MEDECRNWADLCLLSATISKHIRNESSISTYSDANVMTNFKFYMQSQKSNYSLCQYKNQLTKNKANKQINDTDLTL